MSITNAVDCCYDRDYAILIILLFRHNFDIVHYFKHYEAKLDEEIKLAKEKIGREPVQDKKHNDAKLSEVLQ